MVIKRLLHGRFVWYSFILFWFLGSCSRNNIGDISPTVVGIRQSPTSIQVIPSFTQTSGIPYHPTATVTDSLKPVPSTTPTASNTPDPSLNPTRSVPLPTLVVSLTLEERNVYIVDLLENNRGCKYPCLWGFVPGETKWDDAKKIFSLLAHEPYEAHLGKGLSRFDVELQNFHDGMSLGASFYVIDGVIEWITGQTIVFVNSPRLREFEHVLSLQTLFNTYGIPDRISVSLGIAEGYAPDLTSYSISTYYDHQNFMVWQYGFAKKEGSSYLICPNQQFEKSTNDSVRVIYAVKSSDDDHSLDALQEMAIGRKNYARYNLRSLIDVTGVSEDGFYNKIITGETLACLSTAIDLWYK